MPPALKIDWGAARALYVSGCDVDTIVKRMGIKRNTLYQRVLRGGWDKEAKEAQKLVLEAPRASDRPLSHGVITAIQTATSFMLEQKKAFLDSASDVSVTGMQKLKAHMADAQSVRDLTQAAVAGDTLTKIGKVIFGLNDGTQVSVGVQLNVLSELPDDCFKSDR